MTARFQPRDGVPALVCPACHEVLAVTDRRLACTGCERTFPIVAGILDLRLTQDSSRALERDHAIARELEARFDDFDAARLHEESLRLLGATPKLATRGMIRQRGGLTRSEACLAAVERRRGRPIGPGDVVLEVGCGTAALAAAAARRGAAVVATDFSLRAMVLARKTLGEMGIDDVMLVCCGGQAPPFPPGTFDVVLSSDVIEHAGDQVEFVAGCRRALRPGGTLFLATPNRFSLGLEPHVRLWGVGFLPLGLARRLVLAARGRPYDDVRLLSSRRLRRLLAAAKFDAEIVPAEVPPVTQEMYSGIELALVRAYNRARTLPLMRRLFLTVGPFFHVFATAKD